MTAQKESPGVAGRGFGVIQNPQENHEAISLDCQDCFPPLNLSVIESKQILSKRFSLANGELQKLPGGNIKEAVVRRMTIGTPEHLTRLLNALTPFHALAWGVVEHAQARIVPQAMLDKVPPCADMPTIARTAENFTFAEGLPGVFMLDVDTPKDGTPPLTRRQALDLITQVCPAFVTAPIAVTDSASTHIVNSETGEVLKGAGGLRIYAFVLDASDIPRAGLVLFKRLVLAGYVRIEISKAGTLLVRGPIDAAVWKGEHLDFAGGAYCQTPLEQHRPAPEAFNNDAPFLNTRQALPDLSAAEEAEFQRIVNTAKAGMKPEADRVREAWLMGRTEAELNQRGLATSTHPEEARTVLDRLNRAASTNTLEKDFILYLKNGQSITVGELVADPEKFDGVRLADPLEPGCYNDWRIAVALLKGGEPKIYSHAHGGQTYFLEVVSANDFDAVTDCEEVPGQASPREKLKALTVKKEYVAMLGKESWLFQNLVIRGQILTIIAKSGGGKSTIFFDFVTPWIIAHHDNMTVFYFDCDSPASDHDRMLHKAEEIGPRFQWINPLTHGKGPEVLVDALKEFVASGERLDDSFFVLDTLKKFVDMLDKKSVKPFFSLLRQLTALGATIALLGHANKHRDNDGNLVFEGVGDVVSDTDAMIILERVKSADGGIDVTTICDPDKGAKVRGLYKPMSFHIAPDRTVTLCKDVVAVPDYSKDAAKRGRLTEEEIQERIREYLEEQDGVVLQKQIVEEFKGEPGASFHAVRKVLIACAVPEYEAAVPGQIFVRAGGLFNQKLYGVCR